MYFFFRKVILNKHKLLSSQRWSSISPFVVPIPLPMWPWGGCVVPPTTLSLFLWQIDAGQPVDAREGCRKGQPEMASSGISAQVQPKDGVGWKMWEREGRARPRWWGILTVLILQIFDHHYLQNERSILQVLCSFLVPIRFHELCCKFYSMHVSN